MEETPKPVVAEFSFKPGASLKVKGNFILKDSQGTLFQPAIQLSSAVVAKPELNLFAIIHTDRCNVYGPF